MAADNESDDDLPLAMVVAKNNDQELNMTFLENQKEESLENEEPVKNQVKDLFEYEWPKKRCGDFYIIEEEFLQFLGVPELKIDVEKRFIGKEEEYFILGLGYKRLSDNVLKAIKTEDACQYMAELFPQKFNVYIKNVHQKEVKKMVIKQEAQRVHVIKGNIPNIMKRSLKETVRYNSELNRERKEERCAYFDLQTQIIHLPQKKRKYNPTYKPKKSLYPVALIPGQYQDYYKKYSPDELRSFPLNTVTSRLMVQRPSVAVPQQNYEKEGADILEENEGSITEEAAENVSVSEAEPGFAKKKKKNSKDPYCGICMKGPEMNRRGIPEKLIHCSQCENSGHPSCLDMNRHLVAVIQEYPWQCMECKVCTECLAPHDEEAMMFCDNCDRGYHSYCVGLKEIPKGRWVCEKCGKCSSCLIRRPVPDGESGRWKNEISKPADEGEAEFWQIHCHECSKLFRKGSFCPVCLKVYRAAEDHINPMVCCDGCDRWIHTDCDGIDQHRYNELSKDRRTSYKCVLCRGEKEERLDTFHRKNR